MCSSAVNVASVATTNASESIAARTSCLVEVNNISKCYHLYDNPRQRLFQFLSRGRKQYFREFWALHNLSFSLSPGECVGFVGCNGSGKSTLLQMVAGTVTPTTGSISVKGRISALLELGAGFNPEFSGRDNVALNASLLGFSSEELKERLPLIEEFAGIGSFIDQPVKTYSSGMFVRLAFAVASHVSPDVMIIDEALAVGDAAFQYKCLRKIDELRERGVSILFVSHDTALIKRICDRAGWLHEGNLLSLGDAVQVTHQYEDFSRKQVAPVEHNTRKEISTRETLVPESEGPDSREEEPATRAQIKSIKLLNIKGVETSAFTIGECLRVNIHYSILTDCPDGVVIGAAIYRSDGLYVCGLNTLLSSFSCPSSLGTHSVLLEYSSLFLLPGSYSFKVGLFDSTATVRWDFIHLAAEFSVSGGYVAEGVVSLPHNWKVES